MGVTRGSRTSFDEHVGRRSNLSAFLLPIECLRSKGNRSTEPDGTKWPALFIQTVMWRWMVCRKSLSAG